MNKKEEKRDLERTKNVLRLLLKILKYEPHLEKDLNILLNELDKYDD